MKLGRFLFQKEVRLGIVRKAGARLLETGSIEALIDEVGGLPVRDRRQSIENLAKDEVAWDELKVLAPMPHPVKDIICVGLNYLDHVKESQSLSIHEDPKDIHTTYFGKRFDYLRGDGEDITIQSDLDEEMDYEVELAVILAQGGRRIQGEAVAEAIFGYSIGNDFSSRSLQRNHKQWFLGKGLDGYTAMGPFILLHEGEVPIFNLRSFVNGELRQASDTSHLIKNVATIIEEISAGVSLVPGDIIFTGTPAGVGGGFKPPKYLKAGDQVRLEIDGIGSLSNGIVD